MSISEIGSYAGQAGNPIASNAQLQYDSELTQGRYDPDQAACDDTYSSEPVTQDVYVQIPTATVNNGNSLNQAASCPANFAGWDRKVNKLLVDQSGFTITATTQWNENGVIDSAHDGLHLGIVSQHGATTNNGAFGDELFFCSTSCPGSATTRATQSKTDTYNGTRFPLTPNAFLYSCTANTINGN